MKKKIILFALLSVMGLSMAKGQTLHAIIFANTDCPGNPADPTDQGIGPSVENDFYCMKIEMSTIATFIGYSLDLNTFTGSQENFCRRNLESVINNLECGKDDIVFFYYSGHGSRSVKEKTDFPQMNLVVDPYRTRVEEQEANYPIYNVLQRIREKNPRLTIVMGDLCNSVANWVTPKEASPASKGPTIKSDAPCRFYKELFLGVKGYLIASSSQPGETSLGYDDGGAFTKSFRSVLQLMVTDNMSPDWNLLMNKSIDATREMTRNRQTPIYEPGLQKIDPTDVEVQEQPVVTAQEENVTADNEVEIGKYLTAIGSEANSESMRIKLSDNALARLFASPKVKVEVVGRDGKTIVSTKIAGSYLGWLSITTGLEQVMVVDSKVDASNKLTYLKVHEMYNE